MMQQVHGKTTLLCTESTLKATTNLHHFWTYKFRPIMWSIGIFTCLTMQTSAWCFNYTWNCRVSCFLSSCRNVSLQFHEYFSFMVSPPCKPALRGCDALGCFSELFWGNGGVDLPNELQGDIIHHRIGFICEPELRLFWYECHCFCWCLLFAWSLPHTIAVGHFLPWLLVMSIVSKHWASPAFPYVLG